MKMPANDLVPCNTVLQHRLWICMPRFSCNAPALLMLLLLLLSSSDLLSCHHFQHDLHLQPQRLCVLTLLVALVHFSIIQYCNTISIYFNLYSRSFAYTTNLLHCSAIHSAYSGNSETQADPNTRTEAYFSTSTPFTTVSDHHQR